MQTEVQICLTKNGVISKQRWVDENLHIKSEEADINQQASHRCHYSLGNRNFLWTTNSKIPVSDTGNH